MREVLSEVYHDTGHDLLPAHARSKLTSLGLGANTVGLRERFRE